SLGVRAQRQARNAEPTRLFLNPSGVSQHETGVHLKVEKVEVPQRVEQNQITRIGQGADEAKRLDTFARPRMHGEHERVVVNLARASTMRRHISGSSTFD